MIAIKGNLPDLDKILGFSIIKHSQKAEYEFLFDEFSHVVQGCNITFTFKSTNDKNETITTTVSKILS